MGDYELVLTPNEHSPKSSLKIVPKGNGVVDLDMVSLFPSILSRGGRMACVQISPVLWPI